MEYEFAPTFALLAKFHVGLPPTTKTEDEVVAVAKYLGVDLSDTSLDDRIKFLTEQLRLQNGFLSAMLSSEAIFDSDEYRTSMFIREIVANNRINLRTRLLHPRR